MMFTPMALSLEIGRKIFVYRELAAVATADTGAAVAN
jgi:hypothetical protein